MKRGYMLVALGPALVGLAACGGASSAPSDGSATRETVLGGENAGYPVGPYGNAVGDVLPPLAWQGYADDLADAVATTKPFGATSMNALRESGRRYALLHTADFY